MNALVRSELLKIRTIRSFWAYLIVIVAFTALAVAAQIGSAESLERGTVDFQSDLVATAGIALLLSVILGITLVTTEFRFGTVTPTFLVAPKRELVLAAKAIAAIALAIGFALLSLFVIAVIALPWLASVDAETNVLDGEIGSVAAQQILSAVLWALMGVAIGTVVQSQVAALVGTLVWIFIGETLLIGAFGLLDLDGAVRLPALPGARCGRRVGRGRAALVLAGRRGLARVDRRVGAGRDRACSPARHHLAASARTPRSARRPRAARATAASRSRGRRARARPSRSWQRRAPRRC